VCVVSIIIVSCHLGVGWGVNVGVCVGGEVGE